MRTNFIFSLHRWFAINFAKIVGIHCLIRQVKRWKCCYSCCVTMLYFRHTHKGGNQITLHKYLQREGIHICKGKEKEMKMQSNYFYFGFERIINWLSFSNLKKKQDIKQHQHLFLMLVKKCIFFLKFYTNMP